MGKFAREEGIDKRVVDRLKNPYLIRQMSLRRMLPIWALATSLAMCGLFTASSVTAVHLRSISESNLEAERIVVLSQEAVASADATSLQSILDAYAPADIAFVSTTGDLLAGQLPDDQGEIFHNVPIGDAERPIAYLRGTKLRPAQTPLPAWMILALIALATAAATATGTYFSTRIMRAVDRVRMLADHLADGKPISAPEAVNGQFHELSDLENAMASATSAILQETDELRAQTFTDPLSGLPNNTALIAALKEALKSADFEHPLALLRLETDEFDNACETIGAERVAFLRHAVVSRVQKVCRRLSETGTVDVSNALLAHTRIDGYHLLLPNVSSRSEVSTVVRALRSAFVAPLKVDGMEIRLGLSGGVAMAPEDGANLDELLRRTETAIRSLRSEDKRGFRFYAPRLDRVAKGRIQLEAELREGIEKQEIVPFFQPKIDFQTGRLRGCEALARWRRQGGRLVPPSAFIPVAEETGLIEEIGQQILLASCQAASNWLRDGLNLSVAVNVSPIQLRNEGFRDAVLSALSETGLPPAYLQLEITESVAIEDPDRFQSILAPLQAMGVRLAVDDFGTGHSNLAILSRLNFDVFKIDRQFVQDLERDDAGRPIVEMILAMAESLGLETVAEGVETPEHARFLRRRGCTCAQGFLYSPALPEPEFLAFASAWEARRSASRLTGAS